MKMLKLAFKNIRGSGFRSAAIFLCVMGVAAFCAFHHARH
jgi:hypothetical protein